MQKSSVITENEVVEKVIQIHSENELYDEVSIPFNRVYIGNDFCEFFLLDHKELMKIIQKFIKLDMPFSLLTPIISQKCIDKIKRNLETLASVHPHTEVIFNDWGVFNLLRKMPLQPIMGRLLIKNKRDPRIGACYSRLSELNKNYFSEIPISKLLMNFIKTNHIRRVEIDAITYPSSAKRLKEIDQHIPLSFYTKHGIVAHSQECWLNINRLHQCNRNCLKVPIKLRNPEFNCDVILLGNTLFSQARYEILNGENLALSLKHRPRLIYTNYP